MVGVKTTAKKGTFADAQAMVSSMNAADAGLEFYVTDLKKPIYYGGDYKWYDATGTEVTA